MFLETKRFYYEFNVGLTAGASYLYGRLGSPSGHPVPGRNWVSNTPSGSGTIVAEDGTPFDPVTIGSMIAFFTPRPDGRLIHTVSGKASGSSITVSPGLTTEQGDGSPFAFMFYPWLSGTTDEDGWHSVNHFSAITVYYDCTNLASTSIELQVEGGGGGDVTTPVPVADEVSISSAGNGAINIDKVVPSLRVGVKATGPVSGDEISVWVTGEMLQAV